MRLVGNTSQIYTLRTLASVELFLNCEFYPRHPVLIDVYNNGKTVLGENFFATFDSEFELARGLRPFEIGNKNKDLVALVKNETKLTFSHVWSSFLCILALSSVICQSIHSFCSNCGFIKHRKLLNHLIYPREKSNSNCKQILFLAWPNYGGRQKMLS